MIKMNKLLRNVTIIYKDGLKENYEAISITLNGIYTGEITTISGESKDKKFFDHRFIPFDNVEKITYKNKNGKDEINLLKDIREDMKQ